ncbi:MAG: galactose-1-phosphate uridylyltransferase [Elusimicrobia bacterium RIFOXYA2_FULL_39_19]|nr:MAG: galactose-1-phosphate uridylyltransferase [Elusimicrobia bacterium RIFOXYA2_FULL_39_19]
MPDLRRDPVIGRWVIISTERKKISVEKNPVENEEELKTCVFCEGNEHLTPSEIIAYRKYGSLKDKPGWWVRVVPNKYPALGIEGEIHRSAEGMFDMMSGIGAHEVIIETTEHNKELPDIEDRKAEDVIWAYKDRIGDLRRDTRFEYILIFKNRGRAAGASVLHPHSQLIALPMVPVKVKQEQSGSKAYYDFKERCVFCDIIAMELSDESRVVTENDNFIAICPYASRFPFETWILPKRHYSHFSDIEKYDVTLLTQIMKTVLDKINKALDNPPYNYLIHTNPLKEPNSPFYHWHIEIMPKLTRVAGFEWGTGFYINPVAPEEAAKFLREEV